MKRAKTRQMIIYIMGMLVCKITFAGCYPVIPAYFAAVYLEGSGRILISIFAYLGMMIFLPMTAMGKYGMAVLFIIVVVQLAEWVNKGCFTWIAAVAAGASTTVLSISGELMKREDAVSPLFGILEGLFIFGLTMILNRIVHAALVSHLSDGKVQAEKVYKEERLENYAESFQGLSKIFYQMNKSAKDFSAEEYGKMQNEVMGKVCTSCEQCAVCWENKSSPMQGYLSSLIIGMKQWGVPDEQERKRIREYCPHSNYLVEEAVRVFEKAQLNLSWYNRLLENREVIAEQLDAMAYIMEDCAHAEVEITRGEKRMLAEVKYQAKERGIVVYDIHLFQKKDGHLQLTAEVSVKQSGCISVKEFARAVSIGIKREMKPHKDTKCLIGKEKVKLVFEEDTRYHCIHGVARLVKEGAIVSGDNFSFMELEDGETVMSLSDGMGSGSRACKESEMVIELIERFLEAGFSKETAIRLMNSTMVIRGEDDLFSTIDMGALNLHDGMCEFYKIGASTTFIKHQDNVESLVSENLPVGVYHKIEIEKTTRQMEDGDFIIMMTDGVLEYLHVPNPEETMIEIIDSIHTNHPGQLAKKVLERVMLFTGGRVQDDMTVMAAAVWEKA